METEADSAFASAGHYELYGDRLTFGRRKYLLATSICQYGKGSDEFLAVCAYWVARHSADDTARLWAEWARNPAAIFEKVCNTSESLPLNAELYETALKMITDVHDSHNEARPPKQKGGAPPK